MYHLDHHPHYVNEKKHYYAFNIQHYMFYNFNETFSTCLEFESKSIDWNITKK